LHASDQIEIFSFSKKRRTIGKNFRQAESVFWATQTLKNDRVKGYALNVERMENLFGGVSFEELWKPINDGSFVFVNRAEEDRKEFGLPLAILLEGT
jgi:hypothetical protein